MSAITDLDKREDFSIMRKHHARSPPVIRPTPNGLRNRKSQMRSREVPYTEETVAVDGRHAGRGGGKSDDLSRVWNGSQGLSRRSAANSYKSVRVSHDKLLPVPGEAC